MKLKDEISTWQENGMQFALTSGIREGKRLNERSRRVGCQFKVAVLLPLPLPYLTLLSLPLFFTNFCFVSSIAGKTLMEYLLLCTRVRWREREGEREVMVLAQVNSYRSCISSSCDSPRAFRSFKIFLIKKGRSRATLSEITFFLYYTDSAPALFFFLFNYVVSYTDFFFHSTIFYKLCNCRLLVVHRFIILFYFFFVLNKLP